MCPDGDHVNCDIMVFAPNARNAFKPHKSMSGKAE